MVRLWEHALGAPLPYTSATSTLKTLAFPTNSSLGKQGRERLPKMPGETDSSSAGMQLGKG